jgi:hypothetical protein
VPEDVVVGGQRHSDGRQHDDACGDRSHDDAPASAGASYRRPEVRNPLRELRDGVGADHGVLLGHSGGAFAGAGLEGRYA